MAKYKTKIKDYQLTVRAKLSYKEKINEEGFTLFLEKNPSSFLKARKIRNRVIEYTGPASISLYERLKKPVTRYEFFFIIEQIVVAIQEIQANDLSFDMVVLNIHNVFINETTKEIRFIYLPSEDDQKPADIIHFIETIIYSAIPVQDKNQDYFSKFIYFLKGLPQFDADLIEKYIADEEKSVVDTIKRHCTGEKEFIAGGLKDYANTEDEVTELFSEEDEMTALFEDEEGTVLLDENSQIHFPALRRLSDNEMIYIKKPAFRIGKEKRSVDYAVTNNNAVSRNHADIITRGQRCFVIDLNSKNKTFINDQVIPVQQEVEIFDQDRIRLANEEFVFIC